MNEDRKAQEFNKDLKEGLEAKGYMVYEEKNIYERYKSKPDMIAIKGNAALIIETKSEKESKDRGCLTYHDPDSYDHHNQSKNWRKYCRDLVHGDVAIWMVHIIT